MTGQEAELARRLRDGAKTLCEMLMQQNHSSRRSAD